MWATYLHGEDGVLEPHETILAYGELVTHTADRAIDDAAWLFDPRHTEAVDAGIADEDPAPAGRYADDKPTLFDVEP